MLGQRSIYHEGWLACTLHPPLSGWGKFEQDVWELYDIEHDRSQIDQPRRPGTRAARGTQGAVVREGRADYNGLPLDDRTALEQTLAERPSGTPDA